MIINQRCIHAMMLKIPSRQDTFKSFTAVTQESRYLNRCILRSYEIKLFTGVIANYKRPSSLSLSDLNLFIRVVI